MPERLTPGKPERISLKSRLRNTTLAVVMASGSAGCVAETLPNENHNRDFSPAASPSFQIADNPIFQIPEASSEPSYFDVLEEKLELQTEKRFGIILLNLAEYYVLSGQSLPDKDPNEIDWTIQMLILLNETLPSLPDNFLAPTSGDRNFIIVIDPSDDSACVCGGTRIKGSDKYIYLSQKAFESGEKRVLMQTSTHELTHKVQPWQRQKPWESGLNNDFSQWVIRRNEILGLNKNNIPANYNHDSRDDEVDFVVEILNKIDKVRPDSWKSGDRYYDSKENLTESEEKDFFAYRLRYSLGFPISDYLRVGFDTEFFAVLGETYIVGKDYFFDMYGDYFTPEQVEQLYNFARDEIFDGWEYENFKPVRLTVYSEPSPTQPISPTST